MVYGSFIAVFNLQGELFQGTSPSRHDAVTVLDWLSKQN